MKQYDLYIFDVDGTIAERDTTELLPGVAEWFARNQTAVSLATNQGGVGLRHWMETGGFGGADRYKYPPAEEVKDRLYKIAHKLSVSIESVYVSFAYQSKRSGEWSPAMNDIDGDPLEWWAPEWRKPNPGMLLAAMEYENTTNAVMVGDSDEDEAAARAAGIDFIHADDFFGRK